MVRRRNSWDPYGTTASGPRAVDPAWHSAQAGDRVLVEGGERRMIHPGDGLALAPA